MAGIDKTYIDGNDYPLYRQWWIDNYEAMVKEFGRPIYLYPFSILLYAHNVRMEDITPEFLMTHTEDLEHYKRSYGFAIWNTSERQDKDYYHPLGSWYSYVLAESQGRKCHPCYQW